MKGILYITNCLSFTNIPCFNIYLINNLYFENIYILYIKRISNVKIFLFKRTPESKCDSNIYHIIWIIWISHTSYI